MNSLKLLACAAIGVGLSGCATVMNGTNVDYLTETRPEGARVSFIGGVECTSPCDVELRRKDDQRVDIALEGYEPTYVLVQSRLGGSTFGNILLGGGIGAVVDGGNGASNRLYPRPLIVRLAPLGSGQEAMLLDKTGKEVISVAAHNDSVRADVAGSIGPQRAGMPGASE